MLQFAKSRNYTLPSQTAACVDGAAANGHVHVLKWWYQHIGRNQALSYTIDAMDRASANGHVAVLDWFCQSGLELRFTPAALRIAHENGHHDVVNWWHNCPLYASMAVGRPLPLNAFQQTIPDFLMICAFGLSDRLTPDIIGAQSMESLLHALTVACREGQVSVLDLINRHSNLQKRSADLHLLLKEAAKCNQPTVLQWGFRFLPSDGCDPGWWLSSVRVALKRGYINVLELLLAADYLSWDDYAADYFESACEGGCISSLVFLKDAYAAAVDSCSVDVYETAVMAAACHGHVHVLVWLRQNGLDFTAHDEYNWAKVVDAASACGHVHVLQWWMANKLPWQFTEQALWDAVKSKNGELIQWWIDSAQVRGEFMLAMLHDALDELDC
ncbi:hypothetical protein BCR44DRAFT_1428413 [Catenaria anguillulae PL171]|uniref:Ankyrin repeat-containing domain protein n=1 Tax=Catenaria anguillulae PL171 TaxID=765915 RepID=A0A1Y2HZC1_9FUNG|nr:hypothetical protein BCR44DRAFT_1428413 [Catenaria anguillulae PL171]